MGGVEKHLDFSCYRSWDKLQLDGPLGSYADFTFYHKISTHAYLGFGIFFSDCYSYRIAESSSN